MTRRRPASGFRRPPLGALPDGWYVLDRNRDDAYLGGPFQTREEAQKEQLYWRGATDPYLLRKGEDAC